jgi:glucose/arabinose dehydrogenase
VTGLPDSSSPELHGAYGHELKNIAFGPDGKLYVDLGSTCNICLTDTQSDPRRAAIYVYDENGKNGRLFAQGIRNGEGVQFFPDSNELWVTINARDNMPDPRGKVRTEYVDDHPPDTLIRARDGGNYGWPFCQPDPDTTRRNMPFVRDMNMNKDGHVDCSKMDRHDLALGAHVAALGLEFVPGSLVGSEAKMVALIGMRGSWNRSRKVGYKIVYVPFGADAKPNADKPVDLVTGWLNDATQEAWGRPVDAVAGKDGSIFISDDTSGTVYRLYRRP